MDVIQNAIESIKKGRPNDNASIIIYGYDINELIDNPEDIKKLHIVKLD
ncbi:hypothetical protein [Spongiimicrobium salis]